MKTQQHTSSTVTFQRFYPSCKLQLAGAVACMACSWGRRRLRQVRHAQWACITVRKPQPASRPAQHLKGHFLFTALHSRKTCLLLWKETPHLFSKDVLYRNFLKNRAEKRHLVFLLTRSAEMQDTHGTLFSDRRYHRQILYNCAFICIFTGSALCSITCKIM